MKKLLTLAIVLAAMPLMAQKTKTKPVVSYTSSGETYIPLKAENWAFSEGKVEFLDYKGKKAMKLASNSGQVVLKDVVFKEGTIEFDVETILPGFAQSVYFHRKDEKEQEIVYLRVNKMGNKMSNDGIQYTPYFNGINMWDMYPEYQGPTSAKAGKWNHLKLVVTGRRLTVFVNDDPKPVLEIPQLEGSLNEGSIAFDGAAYIADVQVKTGAAMQSQVAYIPDLTNHDANYLRKWATTLPVALPAGNELSVDKIPSAEAFVDSLVAERKGMINLTRKFGANPQRKFVWLKTKITAKEDTRTRLQLGFSDEVWVFVNNQMALVDKNLYMQNMRKYPDGRISIHNTTANLNLKKGENEILVGIANDFYGWGIIARLENSDAITAVDEINSILSLAKEIANLDLNLYPGTYSNSSQPFKLIISKKDKTLMAQASGEEAIALRPSGAHVFRFDQAGIILEFKPTENKLLLKQGGQVLEFVREK